MLWGVGGISNHRIFSCPFDEKLRSTVDRSIHHDRLSPCCAQIKLFTDTPLFLRLIFERTQVLLQFENLIYKSCRLYCGIENSTCCLESSSTDIKMWWCLLPSGPSAPPATAGSNWTWIKKKKGKKKEKTRVQWNLTKSKRKRVRTRIGNVIIFIR